MEIVLKKIEEFGDEEIAIIENKYIVTKNGKVYTIFKKGIKEQKLRKHTNGYLRAMIFRKDYYVHRLVALCFIDNPNGYKEISHEDNNKQNNCVKNLKWCDRSYNNKKMFIDKIKTNEQMKEIAKRPKIKARKFNAEQVKQIKAMIVNGYSDTKISNIFKCSSGVIYQIRKGVCYAE